jgi:acyl-CoA synthetase (AMP-forming)/AMP-acid ligase II
MAITRADTRLTDELIQDYVAKGYWAVPTYPDVLRRNARERGDEVALIDDRRQITWAGMLSEARILAAHLLKTGVKQGDVVGVQLPNRIEYVVVLAAVGLIGAVVCPYPISLRTTEVGFILKFSGAVVAIVPHAPAANFDLVGMMDDLRGDLPALRQVIVVGDAAPGRALTLADIMRAGHDTPHLELTLAAMAPESNDVARILFTSGSTGDPKGVIHTHATTVYSNVRQNEYMQTDERSVMLAFVPVTLNLGYFQVIQAALAPCLLVLVETFAPDRVIALVEKLRVTTFSSPPTGLIAIIDSPTFASERLSSLQFLISGGTPCPVDLQKRLRAKLGCAILDGYGMTEAGWISATTRADRPEDTEGTVGIPFPWMMVRICDEEGRELPSGSPGEITIGGPCVCAGYYKAPSRNEEAWTADGRFRTGDLGLIDSNGRLRIVGRIKDLIKHGGASIYPRDLEELLAVLPKISAVAVIGVPDSYFGENVCVCVVPRTGEEVSLEEIIAFLKTRIATFKLPQQLEVFEKLPYTVTGKIQKHLLREAVYARSRGRLQAASVGRA